MRLLDLCTLPPSVDYADPEAAPLTLPSFIPAERHEAILQYWIRSTLQPGYVRVEVDWRGALYANSGKTLDRVMMRHSASTVALIVRVIDPDLDLEVITRETKIMQYDHVLIVCPHPAKNVRVSRLRYMAAGVTEHLERAYAALVPTHRLNKDAWTYAATVCRVLADPAECVEVVNSLVSMQVEGLAPDRVPDALKSGVVLRQLGLLPMRELVALLAVLAGWDVERTQRVFPEGASAEAARAELVERNVLLGDRLSGWAAWLYDHERARSLLGPTVPSPSRRIQPWDGPLRAIFEALGVDYEPPEQAQAARRLWSDAEASRVTGALDRTRWELDRADELTRSVGGKLAAEKLVAVARLRQNEQRTDDAEALYRAALELDPECVDALAELGWLVWAINDNAEEGERRLREAVRLGPEHVDALVHLGWLLFDKEIEQQTAESYLRRALELAPENTDALRVLGQLRWSLDDPDEGERLLREALRLNPEDAIAWRILGDLLYDEREEVGEALACFQTALRLRPRLKSAHSSLALLLHTDLGRPIEALPHYRAAIDPTDPDPNLLANLVGLLLATGNKTDATEAISYLRDVERHLLDAGTDEDLDTLRLELSFYHYAHNVLLHKILRPDARARRELLNRLTQEAPDRLLPPLQAIHKLLLAGVRSPNFSLTPNVEAARRAGHPHADRVALLARIITEDTPLSLMDGQWDEPDAAPSEPSV